MCMCACVNMCLCICVYVCICVYMFMFVCLCLDDCMHIFEIAGGELSLRCLLKCNRSLCSLACVYWSTNSKGADTDDQSISYSCD